MSIFYSSANPQKFNSKKPHQKIQRPRKTPSARKVTGCKREREEQLKRLREAWALPLDQRYFKIFKTETHQNLSIKNKHTQLLRASTCSIN